MNDMKLKIERIEYHRNGISGAGFHVVTFIMTEGRQKQNMVAFVFEEPSYCAVIDRDLLAKNIIGMFDSPGNAWRGDNFEPQLRKAIKKYDKSL